MLDQLRAAVNSWPAKILLCLILLSFVAWGGHSAFQGGTDDTLLTADDTSVSAQSYDLNLRNTVLRLSQGIGHFLTPDEVKQYGINQMVFSEVYRNLLLDNDVSNLNIGISDKSVAQYLAQDTLFAGQDGKFDVNALNFYLQNLGINRNQYIQDFYVKAAERNQISQTVQNNADAPDAFYKALALYQKQKRDVAYLKLTKTDIDAIEAPDQKTLEKWFKDNSKQFTIPEYRKISYLTLKPEQLAKPADIKKQDIENYYQSHKEQYIESPEKRDFDVIRFDSKKSADLARANIEKSIQDGMTPLDALNNYITKNKTSVEHKEAITEDTLPSLLGSEIFNLNKDKVSEVINDLQGPVIVYVKNISPSKIQPLSTVQNQIRNQLAVQKAAKLLPEYREKIENSRFDGANLKEVAANNSLQLKEITLDKQGYTLAGKPADFPQKESFLPNIFAAAENIDTDPLNLEKGGYLWYNVDSIVPSRPAQLDEVRTKAIETWKKQQFEQRLDAKSHNLASALNQGTDINEVAKQNGLTVNKLDALSRNTDNPKIGEKGLKAIFAAIEGESGYSIGTDQDSRIIYQVNKITEPNNAGRELLSQKEKQTVMAEYERDLLGLYIVGQAAQTPVKINPNIYNQIVQ